MYLIFIKYHNLRGEKMKKDLSVCLEIQEPRQSIIYIIVKRMIDIIMSICGIIVLSPIYIVTAMAIKLESKGPIIFKQRRVGKNSKVFYIYNFIFRNY